MKVAIAQDVEGIPPMPQVAIKAKKIVLDPYSNASTLAGIIEQDQAIAATVLKIANSPFYGNPGQVSSLQRAAMILGTKALYEVLTIALAASVLGKNLQGYELNTDDIWLHSMAVASGCRAIARRYNPSLEDDAFAAGLLHDCGKIVLDSYIYERKIAFTKYLEKKNTDFIGAEEHILGFNHAEIAYSLCTKWKFPDNLSTAIRYHHKPMQSPEKDLSAIVHISDAIAIMSGLGIGYDGMMYHVDGAAFDMLNIQDSDINDIKLYVGEYVKKMSG
ncbi:MAG: HDOD domain-containing protein [Nitrospirae bacterium]|nr:HDOD domain-containing protein [Nitrospirota bacterium]